MAKGKNILTTGDVAKICNVAPRTVSKWFDSGQLKGYRIPGSRDRRIPMNELVRFMRQHGMPTDGLGVGTTRVLIVDCDRERAANLSEILREKGEYEVEEVHTTFETGLVSQKFAPHVMLISLLNGDIDADEICKKISDDEELQTIRIIAMAEHLSESEQNALLQKGFDGYVTNGASPEEIIHKIEQTIAIIY
ncbi:MAG: helix-turn-helix domain-containing protein [Sedimentisphaerales bacterium]|nr:helix-turn-helix domain-containing protein [Sedimentisphaerales bacterium]